MGKTEFFYALIIIFFLCLSLGAFAEPGEGLDVNDVSFLFPLKEGKPLPVLNLVGNTLLNSEIFEQVLTFEKKYTLDNLPYSDANNISIPSKWFVTSMRFDPCGDDFALKAQDDLLIAHRTTDCVPRLRLVVQPFNDFGFPYPTALHLLFRLNPQVANTLIDALLSAKQSAQKNYDLKTSGLTLSIHPILEFEAQSSDKRIVSKIIETAILTTLAQPDVKVDVVTLIVRASINHWKFVGGVVREGRWQRFVTEFSQQFNNGGDPEMLKGMEDLNCTIFSVCLLRPLFMPVQMNPSGVVLSEIFQDKDEVKINQTPGHRSNEILMKSEMIDQVSRVHFFNTNCVSCHQSSNLRDRENLHLANETTYWGGLTPFVSKKYLNSFTNNVINFGYFGAIPRISTRTASESLNVAHAINESRGLRSSADKITDLNQFWQCIVSQDESNKCFKTLISLKEKL